MRGVRATKGGIGLVNQIRDLSQSGRFELQLFYHYVSSCKKLENGLRCETRKQEGARRTYWYGERQLGERLIDYSQKCYTRRRAVVEDKIERWYGPRTPAG